VVIHEFAMFHCTPDWIGLDMTLYSPDH
jgi:hypothetical protein